MDHELKIWARYFDPVDTGDKPFEVRKDDRAFKVGDTLVLREWNEVAEEYTGRMTRKLVTFKMTGGKFGVEPGYCVLAIQ